MAFLSAFKTVVNFITYLVCTKVSGGGDVVVERWRQCTPGPIDDFVGKCKARIWNGGAGGQCKSRCVGDSEFCRTHGKQNDSGRLVHGRVDGDIPEPKYREFLKCVKK